MTAVPIPRTYSTLSNEDEECSRTSDLFPMETIKKNLDFTTPADVRTQLSRISNQAYVESSNFLQVFLRVRPFTNKELKLNEDQQCMSISEDNHTLTLNAPKQSSMFKSSTRIGEETTHNFSFTKIFGPTVQQKEFFDHTALKIVEDFINGQDALIFTYGVTNAGKSYTIQGTPGNEGVMPRSVDVIFNSVGEKIEENSMIQLRNANTVTVVTDAEKKRLLEEKEKLMHVAEHLREVKDAISKDSLDSEQTTSSANSTMMCGSADNTMNKDTKSRLSFLDFTDNIGDDSIVDVTPQGPVKFVIFVSFIEIYKDFIYDLLQPLAKGKVTKRPALKLAEDKVPFIKGVREVQVNSREEVFKLITVGREHLHIAETKLNHNSSRSHCILTIKTVCMADHSTGRARVSQISFCDLAGSERLGKTDTLGERIKEAGKINNSLLTLGKCIETIRHNQQLKCPENQRLVPYRESRLTRLFQKFLVGRGRACMIVNINQVASLFDETAQVLKFSAVASEVKIVKPVPVRRSVRHSKAPGDRGTPQRNHRVTIGWEPIHNTIQEEEEDSSDDEELSQEDVAFWEEKVEKLVKLINALKEALKKANKKIYTIEAEVRRELAEEMRCQFVDTDEKWEERLEESVKMVEDAGERKLARSVEIANDIIRSLREERDDARDQLEELEENAGEERKKVVEDLNEKLSKTEVELGVLQMNVKQKDEEIQQLKMKVQRSRRSSTVAGREEFILNLQQENKDGREIIKEQISEMEEMRTTIENYGEEQANLKQENERISKDLLLQKSTNENLKTEIKKLQSENESQQLQLTEFSTLKEENEKLKNSAELNVQELKNEIAELSTKNRDLTTTLEEAVTCVEMKTSEVDKFTLDAVALTTEVTALKSEVAESVANATTLEAEVTALKAKVAESETNTMALTNEVTALKTEVAESVASAVELSQKLDTSSKDVEERTKLVEDLEQKVKTLENEMIIKIKETEDKLEGEKNEEVKEMVKQHKVEISSLNVKIAETENEKKTMSGDAEMSEKLEKQLIAEVERLQKEMEALKREKDNSKKVVEKRTSDTFQLNQTMHILEMERDDLMKTVNELKQELTKVKHEKTQLEEKLPKLNVAEATELDKMKNALIEMDKVQSEQQTMLEKYEAEKVEIESLTKELREKLVMLQNEMVELNGENKQLSDQRDEFEQTKTKYENEIKTLKNEVEKLTSSTNEAKQVNSDLKQATSDLKHRNQKIEAMEYEVSMLEEKVKVLETSKTKLKDQENEIQALKNEVKEANETKEKELQKFREGRDRIAAALETQINTQKSCNTALKTKLDEQILQNVQLKSSNSKLEAELQVLQRNTNTLRKSSSTSALLRPVKQELMSPPRQLIHSNTALDTVPESPAFVVMHEMSTNMTPMNAARDGHVNQTHADHGSKESQNDAETVISHDATTAHDDHVKNVSQGDHEITTEESKDENNTGRKTRQSNRKTVVKKSSSRRKRGAAAPRPSTPIPSDVLEDAPVENHPPKTRRKRTTRTKSSEIPQIKCEASDGIENDDTLTNEVLDDSGMLKATGQHRGFPESTMEMDVTPKLKKTGTRGRKRTLKSKEDDPKSLQSKISRTRKAFDKIFDSDATTEAEPAHTRTRRRGKVAQESIDDETNGKPTNMSRMGDLLKNSPVGQVFKRFEAAISPSRAPTISSPCTALNYNEPNRQSTRRPRKIHAEDISLPLECTPTDTGVIGAIGRGVGVLSQTQNVERGGSRRLRKRK
nr:kinesin-like protein KIF20B isoform X1 [Ciona intestinalis]|eukprot:XP_018669524.1 kinesin-like protein KIF20B isoform X1 [Ciona intestinalis]